MAKKNQINNNEEQSGDNGGGVEVVLKINLHCDVCAGQVVKAVRSLDGVESVRIGDNELKKIRVIGKIDPVKLRQKVEEKTKKKVELISPVIKKDNAGENNHQSGGAGELKKQQKLPGREKTDAVKDENKPKELPETTAVLKVPLDCQGCIEKIHKLVSKTKGFTHMSFDKSKDFVTVKGRIDAKVVAEALKDKLKRNVEIVTPRKERGVNGGEKKGKGDGGDGEGDKVEGHKMDGGKVKGSKRDGGKVKGEKMDGFKVEGHKMENYGGQGEYLYPQYVYESGYVINDVYAPQYFSDENPNACVVM